MLLCALLLPLGLVACTGNDTTQDSSQDTANDPVEQTAAPDVEDTAATEQADDSGNQDVAVELPGLPIGGNSIVVSDTLQCVDVGWTTPPDLPSWVAITVTGVAFEPSDGFAVADATCEGDTPPCLGEGVQLTADQRCYVPVAWTGQPTLDADRTMSFTSGVATCPPDRSDACEEFRAAVEAAGPQPIGLEPAPSELAGDSGDGSSQGGG